MNRKVWLFKKPFRSIVIKYFNYRIDGGIETAEYIDKNGFFIGNHHYDVRQQITEISKLLQ